MLISAIHFTDVVRVISDYLPRNTQTTLNFCNYSVRANSSLFPGISSGKRREYIHVGSSRRPCLLRFQQIHPKTVTRLENISTS